MVCKKDGTARVRQDYRGLNTLLKSDSGGLEAIGSIFDGMNGASCSTSINTASGFTQIEIAEEGPHKTTFRDAYGTLWELKRCGFGLEALPAGFAAFFGGALGPLKRKGVKNWLDDIVICIQQVEGHLDLLRGTYIICLFGGAPRQCPRTPTAFHGHVHGVLWTIADIVRTTTYLPRAFAEIPRASTECRSK